MKVGIVDIEQAISSTEEGKAAREEFARKQREAEGQVQPMIRALPGLEEELKAKKFVLSDEALFQKQLDIAEIRNTIQNKMKELEGQLQVDQKRLEGPLTAKLVDIIEDIGKSKGFTIIVRRGAPGLLYTREALDITDAGDREVQRQELARTVARLHPTAIVDPRAKLADDVVVGPYVVIGEDVELAHGVEVGLTRHLDGPDRGRCRAPASSPSWCSGSEPQVSGRHRTSPHRRS